MAFNPVFLVLYWAQVFAVSVAAKTYLPRVAGWNLIAVCGVVFAAEMLLVFLALLLRAITT